MATDAQTLLASSNCYNNFSAQFGLLKLGLLRQIVLAQNPMADTSPQALLASSSCYNCYGPGAWPLLELALLQTIANNGGGGGGGGTGTLTGNGSPVGVVTPTVTGQIYTDQSTPGLWESNGLTNTSWIQLILFMLLCLLMPMPSFGAGATVSTVNGTSTNLSANGLTLPGPVSNSYAKIIDPDSNQMGQGAGGSWSPSIDWVACWLMTGPSSSSVIHVDWSKNQLFGASGVTLDWGAKTNSPGWTFRGAFIGSGNLISNVPAFLLGTNGMPVAPVANQVLVWNGTNWVAATMSVTSVDSTNIVPQTAVLAATSTTNYVVPLLPGGMGNLLTIFLSNTNGNITFTPTNQPGYGRAVQFFCLTNPSIGTLTFPSGIYHTNVNGFDNHVTNGTIRTIYFYTPDATGTNLEFNDAGTLK